MERKGIKVKALKERPQLDDVCSFYLQLYSFCGLSVSNVVAVGNMYGFDDTEKTELLKIIWMIEN